MKPAVWVVLSFVFAHSLLLHKEERFMIPILPIFLFLLAFIFADLIKERSFIGLVFFLINSLLSIGMVMETPQSNILNLIRYLNKTDEVKNIYSYEDTLLFFPHAYLKKEINLLQVNSDIKLQKIEWENLTCDSAIAVRKDLLNSYAKTSGLNKVDLGHFDPGILESFVIKANPKFNKRRDSIYLIKNKFCKEKNRRIFSG